MVVVVVVVGSSNNSSITRARSRARRNHHQQRHRNSSFSRRQSHQLDLALQQLQPVSKSNFGSRGSLAPVLHVGKKVGCGVLSEEEEEEG